MIMKSHLASPHLTSLTILDKILNEDASITGRNALRGTETSLGSESSYPANNHPTGRNVLDTHTSVRIAGEVEASGLVRILGIIH